MAAPAAAAFASKDSASQVVDQGSFGIFINGRRVATETFRVEQHPDFSLATAELKVEDSASKVSQSAEMQLAPNGDLRRYLWRETSPETFQATVEPSDQFLVERIVLEPDQKVHTVQHLLSQTTIILDDNFFSQREILAWRYLAAACAGVKAGEPCRQQRGEYAILIPHQHISSTVSLEFAGREKVALRGAARELARLKLESEGAHWLLWLDENYKLVRILIPAENTEVLRD